MILAGGWRVGYICIPSEEKYGGGGNQMSLFMIQAKGILSWHLLGYVQG